MCGISGFIDYKKSTDLFVLENMNRTMEHRGPDGEGYGIYTAEHANVGLGHRRLSIIDLSEGGSQPKTFGKIHITYNGEIYNHAAIKKELEQAGHFFETHSDTEVILHAYSEWGINAVQKFIGMFAFALFNEGTGKLILCRDRAGVKPLFYYMKDGLFLFASELKAFIKHPSFKKEINLDAVASFMQFGYVPAPHCIFKNTYKLKPGHFLEIDINTNKAERLLPLQYWNVYDAYNKPVLKIDYADAIQETENLLKNAFEYRMVSDVPVGVFLSGGYDSACVTAILQKENTQKIKTFTIGMPDAGLNEAPFAKEIAKYLHTDHTEYYCTQKEALEIIPDLPLFFDEPFADSSAIPTILVSRIAKSRVTVALSADAGDEIFAGYTRYDHIMKYGKQFQKIPRVIRKAGAGIMHNISSNSVPVLRNNYQFHSRYEKIKSFLKNPDDQNILKALTKQVADEDLQMLFVNKVNSLPSALESKELKPEFYTTLDYAMAIDYTTYLPDDILQKVDRAGMSTSLEGREPFLDHRIIEWAAVLPTNYKYNNGRKKIILKDIVHKYIPEKMMNRPKMGFGIPIENWLRNDLKKFVDKYLDTEFVKNQNIFNAITIEHIKKSFYEGNSVRGEKIWYILMFQMWFDKWMNNN